MSKAPWFGTAVVMALVIIIAVAAIRWPAMRRARKGMSDLAAQHRKEVPRAN